MSKIANTKEVILSSDSSGDHWSAALWDLRTGSMLSCYKNARPLAPRTLHLLSDSYIVGADVLKPRIYVWPLNNQCPVSNLRLTTPGTVTALTCSPNGSYIVAAVSEKLFVWQVCNGRLLANLSHHYQTIFCLTFNKDGSLFASGAEDGLIFVWSTYRALNDERCAPLHSFSHHSLPVKDLVFGHGGSRGRLYSVSLDRTCNIYDPTSGSLLLTLVFDAPLSAICPNARERDLFIGCTDGNIYQFNLHDPPRGIEHHIQVQTNDEDEKTLVFRGDASNVVSLSVSIDCRYLLSGSTKGNVHIWDIASRQILRTIEHQASITAAFFVKYYENFRVVDLKPRLQISNLQRTSDEIGNESFIQVISRDRNSSDILNFDSYVKSTNNSQGSDDHISRKLLESQEEIEKLKKINTALYQYSVKRILEKVNDTL